MADALVLSKLRLSVKRWLKTILAMPGFLLRPRQPHLRVLFYHRINPYPFAALGPVSRELTVRPDVFEEQLKHLARRGYRSIGIPEFHRMLTQGGTIDSKALLITFDDGYEDNLIWAAPLLKKYGFGALIFIVSDFIGRTTAEVWPNSDPANYGKFLDARQIGELRAGGLEIGSHTVTHPLLTKLAPEQQAQELRKSKDDLEKVIGAPVISFAYPGGDFDAASESFAGGAGYSLAFSTIPGVNVPGTPLLALRRTEVSASDSMLVFRCKMAGALDWLWFKESRGLRRWVGRINQLLIPFAQARRSSDG